MKIYTKTGDDGMTGLLARGRVPKDDLRVEAYGTIDELNAMLGICRASGLDPGGDTLVAQLQDDLFAVGSAPADPDPSGRFHSLIGPDHVARLEHWIDTLEAELPPLTRFLLPGGTLAAAQLHLARTICRRAERSVVRLSRREGEHVPGALIAYLNRLSDLLFVLARVVNRRADVADLPWSGL
ncbi:MAG: cob(I)yrinic acid a,c-diamide adenosyltransferase [Isosphaeraceae bacterium]|nr:cob(I)yrinic acid a,c-diamide adenosyltransferase [Isosphaeraceae bacterium]